MIRRPRRSALFPDTALFRSAWRVVDRGDGDRDGGVGGAVGLTIVGFVSEAVRPVVIEGRGVAETAVAVQAQCAVSRAVDEDRGERIAINIGVEIGRASCRERV